MSTDPRVLLTAPIKARGATLFEPGQDDAREGNGKPQTNGGNSSITSAAPTTSYALNSPAHRIAREQARIALERNRAELLKIPGVIGVRLGYKVTQGWISTTPAIVVTVRQKTDAPSYRIPNMVDGVLVDVAPATPREQLLALSPDAKREVDLRFAADIEELVRKSRYQPPPDGTLDEVRGAMTVVCHASPDAGWPTLKQFLGDTTQRLTVGMYDFTAPHVRDQLRDAMKSVRGPLQLVLDPGESLSAPGKGPNPKAEDIDEEDVRSSLADALGSRFDFVWAAVKRDGKTTAGIFGSAYHIKVAVRDGRSFWLSSGNWQSSNQPDVDPLHDGQDGSKILKTFNREWHAIVHHPALAQTFEQYLQWDYSQAEPLQEQRETAALPALLMPPGAELEAAEVAPQWVAPQQFDFTDQRPLRVQPLLSPDNYAAKTLELVRSARRKLYIQNQYIKSAKDNAQEFQDLLEAVKKCMDDGLDVRIIVRDLPEVRTQLEQLQGDFGFDLSKVRVLPGTHTKGVIVDSSVVSIGSHNWSNDGVLYNRDASLIFHDADIAQYFEKIFLFDWSRARQNLGFESAMPLVATGAEAAPSGYRPMDWSTIYDGS